MVCVVCITSTLIFNESKPKTTSSRSRSGNVATDKAAIAVRFNVRPGILNSREKMDEESKR